MSEVKLFSSFEIAQSNSSGKWAHQLDYYRLEDKFLQVTDERGAARAEIAILKHPMNSAVQARAERDAALGREASEIELRRKHAARIHELSDQVKDMQQRLTAADERLDTAIALLECVLDTGELTREKHMELEVDICQLVTDFWGDRKAARIPSPPRRPDCGYTEQDCRELMDHHLCGSPEPAPARKPAEGGGDEAVNEG